MPTKNQPLRPATLSELVAAGYRFDPSAYAIPAAPAPAEEPTGAMRRIVQDGGISVLKGVIGVPEMAVGLVDLATGGYAGKAAEAAGFRPKDAKAYLDTQLTPETQAAMQKVQQADGFLGKVGAAIQNPSVIGTAVAESLPLMGAGGLVGRGIAAAVPRMSSLVAGAAGEGVVGAGSAAEQIRQESADGTLSAKQAGLAALSGVGTAAFGVAGGKMASKLGIGDVDTMIVQAGRKGAAGAADATQAALMAETKKGVTRRFLEGALSEGVLEELPQSVQEQVLQNAATGKPLEEGVDMAAALGMLSGMAMGGPAGALGGHSAKAKADQIRGEKLPEGGPMSRAVNAGIEQTASDVERGAAVPGITAEQEAQALTRMEGVMDADQKELKAQGRADKSQAPMPPALAGMRPGVQMAQGGQEAGSATVSDSPFADRVLELGQALSDDTTRAAIVDTFGQQGLTEALYYANLANRAGTGLPERTQTNLLAMAEAIVSRAVLKPLSTPAGIGSEVGPAAQALGATAPPAQIGLDTTPTGTIRVDAQGNAAPEVAADAISSRQRAQDAQTLGKQTPRGGPGQGPAPTLMAALQNNPTLTGALRVDSAGRAAPETLGDALQTQARNAERQALGTQAPRGKAQAQATPAPQPKAVPALENKPTPTGRLIAGQDGVRSETVAEVQARQRQAEADAAIGLTPDVRKARAQRLGPDAEAAPAPAPTPAAQPIKKQADAREAAAKVGGKIKRVPNGWAVIPPAQSNGASSDEQGQAAQPRPAAAVQAAEQEGQDQNRQTAAGSGTAAPAAAGAAEVQADGVKPARSYSQIVDDELASTKMAYVNAGLELPLTFEQFMAEVEAGKERGYSVSEVPARLAEMKRDLEAVKSGSKSPRSIGGVGTTKKAAIAWIEVRIQELNDRVATGGASEPTNRSNYNRILRDTLAGEAKPVETVTEPAAMKKKAPYVSAEDGARLFGVSQIGKSPKSAKVSEVRAKREAKQAESSAVEDKINAAVQAGVVLSEADKATIRDTAKRAAEFRARANRTSASGSDPMNKGNAFPMGVGFTKMTKRAEQRIDASVRWAGEAVDLWKKAEQAEKQVDAYLQGKGTEADNLKRAERKLETQKDLVRRLVEWKKGDKIGTFTVERVNKDRDGYPASYTISGEGVVKGVMDRVDVAREFFDGSKEKLRSLVDEARAAEGVKSAQQTGKASSEPASKTPTVDAHFETVRSLNEGTATTEAYQAGYKAVREGEESIKLELNSLTKAELLRTLGPMYVVRPDDKKADYVNSLYDAMVRQYALGKEFGPRSYFMTRDGLQNYKKLKAEALDALVAGQTAEDLEVYAAERKQASEERQAKRAATMAGIENPKTVEDFRNFIRFHKAEGKDFQQARMLLNPEQRAEYDKLEAALTRGSRKQAQDDRRDVRVAGQTVDGNIIATKHTKKGHDLFVVQLAERVSREDYETLNTSAKKMGGYYSSYRGGGAVPGFQFTERAEADAFVKLAQGDKSEASAVAAERRDAFADDRSQTAVQRLSEMADRLEQIADESLGRERKTNTQRRAGQAASAEAAARGGKAMAQTMRNIAESIEAGKAQFLDRVRQKVQVELLNESMRAGWVEQQHAKGLSWTDLQDGKGGPMTPEAADFAVFPAFTAYRSDLASLGRQLQEVDGTKKLGQQIMSVADDVSDAYLAFAKDPANYHKLAIFSTGNGQRAGFSTKDAAERAIARSGFRGQAIPYTVKRGEHTIILSPSEAIKRGIWKGDGDKRITLTADFGSELVEKIGRANRRGSKVSVPWQFESAYAKRKTLARMGIETPAEFRAALREFAELREQPAEADKVKAMERAMIGRKNDGLDFFPTPEGTADQMVAVADLQPGMRVLEPSAGWGHIAERIRAAGIEPEVGEMAQDRRELLEAKGFNVVSRDFLDFDDANQAERGFTFGDLMEAPDGTRGILRGQGGLGSDRVRLVSEDGRELGKFNFQELTGVERRGAGSGYDRILMNPPFSDGRDIQHVQHAFGLLKPGGRLVAIMGESAFTNQNRRAAEFREWLESVGGTDEKLDQGTFLDPSLPVNTGANARLVVIEKGDSESPAFSRSSSTVVPRVMVEMDAEGNPEFTGEDVDLRFPAVTQRVEQIEGPGQQILNYVVMPAGRFEAVGYVEVLMEDGRPVSLLDMAVGRDHRGGGVGRQILTTLLAANPEQDLNISNIVPEARGFWERMGIPAQNVEGAYDGTLNWKTLAEATNARGARSADGASKAASGERDAGGASKDRGAMEALSGERSNRGGSQRDEELQRNQAEHVAWVESVAASITAKWANAPKVVVVYGLDDPKVPQAIRDEDSKLSSQDASGQAEGVYFKGVTYLNAGSLRDEANIRRVLFHEALGHYGLRRVYGKHLDGILQQMVRARPAEVLNKALEYGFNPRDKDDLLTAAEEVLAEMAQSRPELGFVRRAVAAIRTFMRSIGFKNLRLSDDEIIRNYILPARRFVEQGGSGGPKGGKPKPQKADSPRFSRSTITEGLTERLNSARGMALPAGYLVDDFITSHGKLGWWQKTVGTPYALAKKSPAFKRVFDAVQRFLGDVSTFASEAADLAPQILPKLDKLADLKKSALSPADTKALSRPVFEGTLSWRRDEDGRAVRVTPDDTEPAGIVFNASELRDLFGLNNHQIGLYEEFRRATDESLRSMTVSEMIRLAGKDLPAGMAESLMDMPLQKAAGTILEALGDAVDEESSARRAATLSSSGERIQQLADRAESLQARGYAPLSRFGTYTLDVLDESGERVYFGLFESQAEANRMARKMRQAYPSARVAQGTLSQEAFKLFAGVSPETMEIFGELLGLDATGDEAKDAAFQEYIKRAKNTRSAMKRLIHRQGIAGFSEDAGRVLAGFIYSNARATSSNLHQGEISEHVQAIVDTKGQGELADYAVKLAEYVKNPQEEAQAIRGVMFAHFLGGSVASALVNMTQPMAVTFPFLSQFGGVKAAASQLTQAFKDVAAHAAKGTGTGDAALDAALKRAEEDGTVSPQEVFHLMAQAQGKGALQAGDGTRMGDALAKANNAKAKVMLAWGKLFGFAEQVNRRVTFIAAYRMAPEGVDPAEFARNAVTETQFTYNKGNKPQWARGTLGSLLFTFKQYSVNYIELIARMAGSGREGRNAALLAVAVLALAGGADELPFMKDAEDLIDGVMQRLGYNFNSQNRRNEFLVGILGKDLAPFAAKGLTGIPGMPIDLSGRLGMGNLIPGTGLLTKKSNYTNDVIEIIGPTAKLAQGYFKGASSLADGEPGGALESVLPVAAANIVKGVQMATTGEYRDARGRKVLDVTMGEAIGKAAGFQPNSVAKVQEAAHDYDRSIATLRLEKQEITAEWAQALADKDADGVERARQRLATWNQNNPDTKIARPSPVVLRKKVAELHQDRATRLAKSAPKEMREKIKRDIAEAAN